MDGDAPVALHWEPLAMFEEMTPAATLPVMRRTVLSQASQRCRHPATHQLPAGGRELGHSCACALARDRYSYSSLDVAAFPLLSLLLLPLFPLLVQLLERACASYECDCSSRQVQARVRPRGWARSASMGVWGVWGVPSAP